MDIEKLKAIFKQEMPDFVDFMNPGPTYPEQEYAYKKTLSELAHEIFDDWVSHAVDSLSPKDFTALLHRLLRGKIPGVESVQNLSGWRDNSIFFDEILNDERQIHQFMSFLHSLFREAATGDGVDNSLGVLLDWLTARDCPPSLTKVFPTFFLFIWNPACHFFIKPRVFDRFLRNIGEKPLGSGFRLTPVEYRRVLSIMNRIGKQLEDWRPRDMIDLHSFFWVVQDLADFKGGGKYQFTIIHPVFGCFSIAKSST